MPAGQYGNPGPGGTYDYFDVVALNPPVDATYAEIDLLYQPTSWEYIQFLYLANDGSVPFLAFTGVDLLDAWQATGMAEPEVMASATWGTAPVPVCTPTEPSELSCDDGVDNDCDDLVDCNDTDCGTVAVCLCDQDGVCDAGEDCEVCASDCAGVTNGRPSGRYCCGNGVPESQEGDGTVCDGNY